MNVRELWTACVDAEGYLRAPLVFFIMLCLYSQEPHLFGSFEPRSECQTTLDEFAV